MSVKPTVLIIEDNAMNMKLARDILEATGYTVLTAATGEAGVALAIEACPDLVLMDIELPGVDGVEAFTRLRADTRTRAIPVAAFTASVTARDRSRVTAVGFDAFVSKPIDLKTFVATVDSLLGVGAR